MRRHTAFVVLGGIALLVVGCSNPGDLQNTAVAAELVHSNALRAASAPHADGDAAAAVNAFASDVYRVLARDDQNLAFSPYSAAIALAMTRAGAAGETAAQMDAVLHADLAGELDTGFNALEQTLAKRSGAQQVGEQTVTLELATANQLWGQRGFEFHTAFLDRLATFYGAGMRLVNFRTAHEQARRTINQWAAEQTHQRIPEVLPSGVLTPDTRLVLTNAIYLKAPRLHPFGKQTTAAGPFYRLDGRQTQADFMRLMARLRYARGVDYEAVELPYVGGALSMVVIVPDRGAFAEVERSLDAACLRQMTERLGDALVTLRLPRFAVRNQAMLKSVLSELGMPIAFTADADFTGMSPHGARLELQEVVHEAFIAVDEDGTEAAAATAAVVGVVSEPPKSVTLTVDRPFVFLIRENQTGALLFLGRLLDPHS